MEKTTAGGLSQLDLKRLLEPTDEALAQAHARARRNIAFEDFASTVEVLCDPVGGCPWDSVQTHESLASNFIEEAYEAVDAIEAGDSRHLQEELGDVLLQILLQSQIAERAGEFDLADVCRTADAKMIRRHPHVFANAHADNPNEVRALWEQVKLAEQEARRLARQDSRTANAAESQIDGHSGNHVGVQPDGRAGSGAGFQMGSAVENKPESLLDDVPTSFPALLQAQKVSRKAAAAGFEWSTVDDVWSKVAEEVTELKEAYAAAPKTADGKMSAQGVVPNAIDEGAASCAIAPEAGGASTTVMSGDSRAENSGASDALVASGTTAPDSSNGLTVGGSDVLVHAAEMEMGDVLFALVNVARKMGIDAETALRRSCDKFRRRWGVVEEGARKQGVAVDSLSMEQMEELWASAKEDERS